MSEDTPPLATLFDPRELEQAAVACCGRFGDPAAETQRLVTQRDLIAASSALAHELESFAKAASTSGRGKTLLQHPNDGSGNILHTGGRFASRLVVPVFPGKG